MNRCEHIKPIKNDPGDDEELPNSPYIPDPDTGVPTSDDQNLPEHPDGRT